MPKRMLWIYTCSLCKSETDSDEKMTEYQLSMPGNVWTYDVCATCEENDPAFRSFIDAGLRERQKSGRRASGPLVQLDDDAHQCEMCNAVFGSARGLTQHRYKSHGAVSQTPEAIAQRDRGQGPLKCPECAAEGVDYGAKASQGLAAHRRHAHDVAGSDPRAVEKSSSSGKKPAKCPHCGKTYSEPHNVLRHIRSVHPELA